MPYVIVFIVLNGVMERGSIRFKAKTIVPVLNISTELILAGDLVK